MHFDKHHCSLSHKSVSSAVSSSCTSFSASLTVLGVSAAIWVLDESNVVVLVVVASGVAINIISDMAVEQQGLGCETGDRGTSWGVRGAVGWLLDRRLEFLGRQGHSVE